MTKPKKAKAVWPADQVSRYVLSWFKPFKANPKQHSAEQIKQIRASIEQWGWTVPILADETGEVIAGHGRLLAAKLTPAYPDAPVVIAKGWTEAQKRAYRIADNKLTENGQWDAPLLKAELQALDVAGFDLQLTGFSGLELSGYGVQSFAAAGAGADPEEVPPLPTKAAVKTGELWILGHHRLLIGDSTVKADVDRLFKDGRKNSAPNLMVTDPPYGVNYNPAWRNTARRSTGELLSTGKHSMGKVNNDDQVDWREAWKHFAGDVAYVWHSGLHCAGVQGSLEAVNFEMRSQIIWNKNVMVISRGHYHFKHEPCWYAVRKGKTGAWAGDRKQTSVWDIPLVHATAGDVDDGKNAHGTQKPLECMRRPILNNSKEGDGVYDPFVGSGTTLIACEAEKRRCFAMEISPIYAQVVIERWQKVANKIAKREDGATLEQLKKGGKNGTRGTQDAAGGAGKPVPGKNTRGNRRKRKVRKSVSARQPAPGGGANSQPPVVDPAGNSGRPEA